MISGAIIPNKDVSESKVILFEYPDKSSITGSFTLKFDGVIQNVSEIEIRLTNNIVTEFLEGEYKMKFKYNADQIEEIIEYESDQLRRNSTYTYSSGKLEQIIYVEYESNQIYQYKNVYTYKGEEINEIINYSKENDGWITNSKDVYTYTSGRISKIQRYYYINDSWVISDTHKEYNYDSFGNLIEVDEIYAKNIVLNKKTKYTYEEGSGNYRQIFSAYNEYPTEPIPNKKSQGFSMVMNSIPN